VLTLEQLATLLELDVEAVHALAEQGDIPGRRLGEQWRFSRAAILAWLGGE
jgi:excisionase family DNA binding protein